MPATKLCDAGDHLLYTLQGLLGTEPMLASNTEDFPNRLSPRACAHRNSRHTRIGEIETYGVARYPYIHSIQHFSCPNQQGKKLDLIFRVTDGYANFGNEWLIAHEHVSEPVDLTTGRAVLQSKP